MGAIISLLVIAGVSLIIVRIGSIAMMMTGLSWEVANFQAYSAFFGVGFTTAEAELAISTPQRRRIIKHLILTGNLGLTAALGSGIVAFVKADGIRGELFVLLYILTGTALVAFIAYALHLAKPSTGSFESHSSNPVFHSRLTTAYSFDSRPVSQSVKSPSLQIPISWAARSPKPDLAPKVSSYSPSPAAAYSTMINTSTRPTESPRFSPATDSPCTANRPSSPSLFASK